MEALGPLMRDNPKGLLVAVDELSGWLGGFDKYTSAKGSDVGYWLSMFSGNPTSIDRVTNGGVLYIRSAAACVTGGIQPKILAEMLGPKNVENGLAARFLMAYLHEYPRSGANLPSIQRRWIGCRA